MILRLQVIYSQLIQFSLTAAQDSIQAAIASEAHVSSLRVVDIFLSSASQTSGVDVWFVLLQKPRLDSGEAVPSGAGESKCLTQTELVEWSLFRHQVPIGTFSQKWVPIRSLLILKSLYFEFFPSNTE